LLNYKINRDSSQAPKQTNIKLSSQKQHTSLYYCNSATGVPLGFEEASYTSRQVLEECQHTFFSVKIKIQELPKTPKKI
jgi:hypothetical protein